jgi:hypothetical protein
VVQHKPRRVELHFPQDRRCCDSPKPVAVLFGQRADQVRALS